MEEGSVQVHSPQEHEELKKIYNMVGRIFYVLETHRLWFV